MQKQTGILLALTLLLSSCTHQTERLTTATATTGLQLQIIHINDTHSQFDASPAKLFGAAEQPLYTFIGGHPRVLSHARTLRQQAANKGLSSLFLHGGDAFKGSAYFELFEHEINIDILNRMQLDAMALGNHEFDIGLEKLAQFASQVNFPVLAANVDSRAEPRLAKVENLKPFQLFRLVDQQWQPTSLPINPAEPVLAVFGLALEDMRAMVPDTGALVFADEVASAQQTVDFLQQQGVKHIVALTHLGHQRDRTLAAKVNGIDVIVGGHSHTLLGDFRQWSLGQQAPYAEQIRNADGKAITCVVQAGQFAQAVGALTVSFDRQGQINRCDGQNTLLASKQLYHSALRQADSQLQGEPLAKQLGFITALARTAITEEDANLRQVLDEVYLPAVQQAYGKQISALEQTLSHVRLPGTGGSDQHGSLLAAHITDGIQYWLNSRARAELEQPVDFTLLGAGNIRSDLTAGAVFEGHIRLEVLPFASALSVLTVSGADVLALLQQTISATLPAGAHAGKFPYSSHLRYTAIEQADGRLVLTDVAVLQQGQWQALLPERQYRLATTDYLANGNDGWHKLQQVQQNGSDRRDIILLNGQPKAFAVTRVRAEQDASGKTAYVPEYAQAAGLPCQQTNADCKVPAEAFIRYLQAYPALWQQTRPATVTLQRAP
ncbi:bifunctional metallophosphatase/5'-nucleotidase [Alishewanella sp. HL-SH05]|uniref:bifunctional metallophosphatase/5'-nucleotidase n=1 Tax=Alishewanella sp. HL-SH05 TaxID=3461145 RepID=UPI0040425929